MKFRIRLPIPAFVAVLVLGAVAPGCARRAAEAPPAPAAPPPVVSMAEPETPPTLDTMTVAATAPPAAEALPEFDPAFFRFDSYMLDAPAREALDRTAMLMRQDPKLTITIEGHCDERGGIEYNMALGQRRAVAARDYLVAEGIHSERIRLISYGKERPFAMGHDETAWSQNRRAQVTIRDATMGALTTDSSK